MKNKIFFLIAVFVGLGFAFKLQSGESPALSLQPGDEWRREKSVFDFHDAIWVLKSDARVVLTLMEHNKSEIANQITDDNLSNVIKEFKQVRTGLLSLQGIDDWKLKSHDLTEDKEFKRLDLSGTYTDTTATAVQFNEVHLFKDNRIYLLSLIYPKESEFSKKGDTKAVVSRFLASVKDGGQK